MVHHRRLLACCVFIILCLSSLTSTHRIDVTEYGVKGDGSTVNTAAIAKAFAACAASPSAANTVVFPSPGVYVTGPWEPACNGSTVVIEQGARVVSVPSTKDWPIGRLDCPEPSQGKTNKQAAPFVLLDSVHGVTLTGGGELDARGKMFWDEHCGNWWCPPGYNSTAPRAWRPYMLRIHASSNIVVTNLSFVDPGFWCIVPTYSQDVKVTHSTVDASHSSPNTDGVEPMWTSNVHIHDMRISNGDDCITVKSGSSDVLIENIHCNGSHGITIGSVWYDDVANVTYRNCTLEDCHAGPRIKGRSQGNATIRDISFENIVLLGGVKTGIQVEMNYETPGTKTNNTGVTAENVSFVDVSGSAEQTASIECDSRRPCTGIQLSEVHIRGTKRDAWSCKSVEMSSVHDVSPLPGASCHGSSEQPQSGEEITTSSRPLYLSAWSYAPWVPNQGIGEGSMWSVDDWITVDAATGTARPWLNLILGTSRMSIWVELSSAIYNRTGVNVPVLWSWPVMDGTQFNVTALESSLQSFASNYSSMTRRYAHLPSTPFGMFLGDEPKPGLAVHLPTVVQLIKRRFPNTVTYINWKWADLTANDPDAKNASVAAWVGKSGLDWVSSDEYYDVTMANYQSSYRKMVYPYLQPHQRVIVLPFAAWCELKCPANVRFNLKLADSHCLSKAQDHFDWYRNDSRVIGMIVYRFKNIWWPNGAYGGADPCNNPGGPHGNANGLGLVDKCGVNGTGSYATPQTLAFYKQLLAKPVSPPRTMPSTSSLKDDLCPFGLWYRQYINSKNVTVSNYLSITHSKQLFLQNLYSKGSVPHDGPCAANIGPYVLNINASFDNTTMNIGASANATCRESLRPSCRELDAVCRPDSAFDDTDSYTCKGGSVLEMHDGSAGSVIAFARTSCNDVPTHNFVPVFCRSEHDHGILRLKHDGMEAGATFSNPLCGLNCDTPDPWIQQVNGTYYWLYTSTPMHMRTATTLAGLHTVSPSVVWSDPTANVGFWAPELHFWSAPYNTWYIYFVHVASTQPLSTTIGVLQSTSGRPDGPWTSKGLVANAGNGSSNAIDPNVLHHPRGKKYLLVKGERMWITELANPWTTIGTSLELPLLKCTLPEVEQWYEAPATYVRGDKIWLMYSRCNTGPDYQLMLAYCDVKDDLIDAASWKHFSKDPVIVGNKGDCTGPGHNGWFTSPDGTETWLVYHGTAVGERGRSSRVMHIPFNSSGWPVIPKLPPITEKLPEPSV